MGESEVSCLSDSLYAWRSSGCFTKFGLDLEGTAVDDGECTKKAYVAEAGIKIRIR